MRTIEFDLITTLLVALAVLFIGRFLVAHVPVLARLNIPAPVVGGGLMALLLAIVDGFLHVRLGFDLGLRDTLLLIFFTTAGLAADARMLAKGGPRLLIFLALSIALIVAQNAVGLTAVESRHARREAEELRRPGCTTSSPRCESTRSWPSS